MKSFTIILLALILIPLAVVAGDANILVEDARISLMPPGSLNTAGFLTLKNNSKNELSLIGAEGSFCKSIELHTHKRTEDGYKMMRVDKIPIPANGHVKLTPGGDHIMFFGLKKDLVEGQDVSLTLLFSDENKKQIKIKVQKARLSK